MTVDEYRDLWVKKTVKQIEREIESMRKYMQRHTQAYAWHGKNMKAPGDMADGDRLLALREALRIMTCLASPSSSSTRPTTSCQLQRQHARTGRPCRRVRCRRPPRRSGHGSGQRH